MVSILFEKSATGLNIEISGHAGYAEEGKDIVCASVSILASTAADLLNQMYDAGWLDREPELDLQKGKSVLRASSSGNKSMVMLGMYGILTGFRLLASSYPGYVSLEESVREESST